MVLKRVTIKHFRNIQDTEVNFTGGLNVIIGSNSSGKTALIDALRLCLCRTDSQSELKVFESDFFLDQQTEPGEINSVPTYKPIELAFYFITSNEEEASIFRELLSEDGKELVVRIKYELKVSEGKTYVLPASYLGGSSGDRQIPYEIFLSIQGRYLAALRDSNRDLETFNGNRIGELVNNLETDPEKKAQIAQNLSEKIAEYSEWKQLRDGAQKEINSHLQGISLASPHTQKLEVVLNQLPLNFGKLTSQLRAKVPVYKKILGDDSRQQYFEVRQNGLGDNNRIYLSTVLGNFLTNGAQKNYGFYGLLIEEPEAHLHPQLQTLLLQYFNDNSERLNIQVFVTSHSPTITAKTPIDNLIVLHKNNDGCVKSIRLGSLDIGSQERAHLTRFLDVTKSQMLFAEKVLFVEGISESLLLPVIFKSLGTPIEKLGIEIVNIGGVAFKPYALLFKSGAENDLKIKCALLTDGDESKPTNERITNLKKLESDNIKVFPAIENLEYELTYNNIGLATRIFEEMHTGTKVKKGTQEETAMFIAQKLNDYKTKADFAQNMADAIAAGEAFKTPDYIVKAVSYLTD